MPAVVKPILAAGIIEHRLRQPPRVGKLLEAGEIDAVMAFYAVVTPRLVKTVHDAGGELYSWTVDDAETIEQALRRWASTASSATTPGCSTNCSPNRPPPSQIAHLPVPSPGAAR